MSMPLVILKAGSAPPAIVAAMGDYEDWITNALDATAAIEVIDVRAAELPDPATIAGAIITGSRAMVTEREPWSRKLETWAGRAADSGAAILGICYGHQLLAQALGGEVINRPQGVEIGTVTVKCTPDAATDILFGHLPAHFPAQTIHWQSIARLPANAVLLANTDDDPLHAFRLGKNIWGVQFHPEFSAPAMTGHFNVLGKHLARQAVDAQTLSAQVESTPGAESILPAFAAHALARTSGEHGT